MAQINIPSSGVWATIATALNNMFTDLFGSSGWVSYNDTQYTAGSPLVVTQGTDVAFPNNAGTVISSQIPLGLTPADLYDNGRIQIPTAGDYFVDALAFTASGSSISSSFRISLDISPLADGSNVIYGNPIVMTKAANTAERFNIPINYFGLTTFKANGGLLKIEAVTGDISVYDTILVRSRVHKAR